MQTKESQLASQLATAHPPTHGVRWGYSQEYTYENALWQWLMTGIAKYNKDKTDAAIAAAQTTNPYAGLNPEDLQNAYVHLQGAWNLADKWYSSDRDVNAEISKALTYLPPNSDAATQCGKAIAATNALDNSLKRHFIGIALSDVQTMLASLGATPR